MIKLKILVSLLALLTVNACIPLLVGSGTAVGGKIFSQDKTLGESISDTTIWTKIRASFLKEGIDGLWGSINVTVNEGRVLITGTVKKKEDIVTILKIVWEQNSVKDVINEVKVATRGSNKGEISKYAKDTWITTKIKSKMFVNADIRSVNYNVETIDGVVYLFGVARSKKELELVENIAYGVEGVQEVKSYIKVKQETKPDHKYTTYNDFAEDDSSESKPVTLSHDRKDNRASPLASKEYEVGDVQHTKSRQQKNHKAADDKNVDEFFNEEQK